MAEHNSWIILSGINRLFTSGYVSSFIQCRAPENLTKGSRGRGTVRLGRGICLTENLAFHGVVDERSREMCCSVVSIAFLIRSLNRSRSILSHAWWIHVWFDLKRELAAIFPLPSQRAVLINSSQRRIPSVKLWEFYDYELFGACWSAVRITHDCLLQRRVFIKYCYHVSRLN